MSDDYNEISFSTLTVEGAKCELKYYGYLNGEWIEQRVGHEVFFPRRLLAAQEDQRNQSSQSSQSSQSNHSNRSNQSSQSNQSNQSNQRYYRNQSYHGDQSNQSNHSNHSNQSSQSKPTAFMPGSEYYNEEVTAAQKVQRKPTPFVPDLDYCNEEAAQEGARALELDQIPNLFVLSDLRIPYFVIIGSWNWGENDFRRGDVKVDLDEGERYEIPDDFKEYWAEQEESEQVDSGFFIGSRKVRLNDYSFDRELWPYGIRFKFSPIRYTDFLMTSNRLDYPIVKGCARTFRDKYFSDRNSPIKPELSCICGVGVFIITEDDKIIIRKSTDTVEVAAKMYSYAASGTMDWNDSLHPFDEIHRECVEEIGHFLNMNDLFMFAFGMDYNQSYFQFSFYEESPLPADQIINSAKTAVDYGREIKELIPLDYTIEEVVNHIRANKWEPAAAATLLTLLVRKFSKEEVENYINPHLQEEGYRAVMEKTWDKRAHRSGSVASFSSRVPLREVDRIAEKFLDEVLSFIGGDLPGRSVLEAGCGIGLMTKRLAESARSVCCVDLSGKMIERNMEYLGPDLLKKVKYQQCFIQDFQGDGPYDLLVSAQMLIHNKEEFALKAITDKMKALSDTIFLFEQLDTGIQTSPETKARPYDEYVSHFPEYQVEKVDPNRYIFTDRYVFIKLVRQNS